MARQIPATDTRPGTTYAYQDQLQKLPIPDLEKTCRNYLDAVRPLQTHREHAETRAAVREFLKTDGPELQERLKKYASSKSSYIEQFCELHSLMKPSVGWTELLLTSLGYDSYLNYDNRKFSFVSRRK